MKTSKNNNPRWWEEEPLMVYETHLSTLPGFTCENNWQQKTDPAIEVDVIKATNALQTHLLHIIPGHLTNQFCYFKSDKFREQRRDYLAAYLKKSRKAGYRTIIYFNVHAIKPAFGADYPEWRQIRYNGTAIDDLYGIETSFCVNSPWRNWVRDVCLDLCKYPIDGIFFDGPCMFWNCCYCEHCKKKYREQYGTEIPPKEAGHPELKKLASFQAESLGSFIGYCNQAIKSVRPDVALYTNAGAREEPYYAVGRNNRVQIKDQDILAAEGGFVYGALSTQPVWKVGSNAKYYQTQAAGKPTGVFNSSAHGPWRSYALSDAEYLLAMVQAPIHGSGVWGSGFQWRKDQPIFPKIASHYKFFSDHRDVYFKTRPKARVAIVWPEDSINFYGKPQVLHGDFTQGGQKGETVGDISEEFDGFYDALIKNHIPCDIIDEDSVRSEDIARYDLLILPNVGCTGKAFDDRLREYVRNGGNVVASFETSICDENGIRKEDLSLADVFGIKMLRTPLKPYPHFYFFKQDSWKEIFTDIHPPLLASPLISTEVALAGAKTVSPYSIKFKGWDGSEILPSEFPAITRNDFGKGRAVYMAGVFGGQYWNYKQMDIRLLLRNLYMTLSRQEVVLVNAPTSVEVTHRETGDGKREVVSLINYTGGLTRPFEKIETLKNITIRILSAKKKAKALRMKKNLPITRKGEWLKVTLPLLDIFETIVFE